MQRIEEPGKEGHIMGRTESRDLEIAHSVRHAGVGHTVAQGRDSAMHGERRNSLYIIMIVKGKEKGEE
jgi:hypothetical protein